MKSISSTKAYAQLSCFLKRKKLPHQRKLATLLLTKFGQAKSPTAWQKITKHEDLMPKQILKKDDSLDDWRTLMEKKGILICKISPEERDLMDTTISNYEAALYKFGPAIEKYILDYVGPSLINRIDEHTAILDSHTTLIENHTKEIEVLNNRMSKLEKLVFQQIEVEDPPATKEKLERKLKLIK